MSSWLIKCRAPTPHCAALRFLGAKARWGSSRHLIDRRCCAARAAREDQPDADLGDLNAQLLSAARVFEALEEYKVLLNQPDEKIDMLMGAALIAQHRYPLLDIDLIIEQLDDLAEQVEASLPAPEERYPLRVVQSINSLLYQQRGFRGARDDYYNPDNSCINKVLDLRIGIPITLSLVYMEVAKRVGLPMLGVNIPGHFFLTPAAEGTEFFVDAFEGGDISFAQDVEATLTAIYRRPVKVAPELLARKEQLPARTFLARMLNNLKQVYTLRKDYSSAYLVSCYLQATRPTDAEVLRDSGVFLYYLKRFPECKDTLHRFLELAPPDSEDVPKIQRLLDSLSSSEGVSE